MRSWGCVASCIGGRCQYANSRTLLNAFRDIFERGSHQQPAVDRILTGTADVEFHRTKLFVSSQSGFINGGPRPLEHPNFFIAPQGRCAEAPLFSAVDDMMAKGRHHLVHGKPATIISNGFFGTTGANAAAAGFQLFKFLLSSA